MKVLAGLCLLLIAVLGGEDGVAKSGRSKCCLICDLSPLYDVVLRRRKDKPRNCCFPQTRPPFSGMCSLLTAITHEGMLVVTAADVDKIAITGAILRFATWREKEERGNCHHVNTAFCLQ